jgi:sigma-B regulation protein RsbU (phosphoserine phosphatase)
MEQQQFRVSFSLSTKLLLSVVTLLLLVITFLTLSTIFMLTEDKRAYTYQLQGTENVLAGRDFVNLSSRVFSTLQVALAAYDPLKEQTKGLSEPQERSLQSYLDNQSDLTWLEVGKLAGQGESLSFSTQKRINKTSAEATGNSPSISSDWWRVALPALLKDGYYFINLSTVGKDPLLAVLRADLNYRKANSQNPIPVAIGYAPLTDFGKELRGSRVTVANQDGFVLHDTDSTVQFANANLAKDPIFLKAIRSRTAEGAEEFNDEKGRFLGSFYRTNWQLVVLSRTDWRKAMSSTYTLTEKFALLGLMCIAAAVMFALFFAKSLTAPILALYQATRQVAAGKFDLELKSKSSDEIGALGDSFNVMSRKISELIEESMKKVHLENEMAIASTVQKTLFPEKKHETERFLIHSHYQSASQCGGDWWGFFEVRGKLCLMIADATGHGMPSALITASARSCFSVMHKLAQEDPDFSFSPGAMLAFANRVINEAALGQIMMTFFVCVIDFNEMKLTHASAGHNPPWLFRSIDSGKPRLVSLTADGPRVGETRDVGPYPEKTLEIASGDVLFMYTDGVMEGKDRSGKMFGKKRVRKNVEGTVAQGPEAVVSSLMQEFLAHNLGKDLDDDVTLAVVKIK